MAREKNGAITQRRSTTGGPGRRVVDQTNWRTTLAAHRLKFDDVQKEVFLQEFAKNGRVMQAALAATVSQTTIYNHIENDPDFAEAFEQARAIYRDHIREKVYELAVVGVQEPIVGGEFKDEIVAYKTIYFPNLLAMEAKRVDPEYREKQLDGGGINIQAGVVVIPAPPGTQEEYERRVLEHHQNLPTEAQWRAERAATLKANQAQAVDAQVLGTAPPVGDKK